MQARHLGTSLRRGLFLAFALPPAGADLEDSIRERLVVWRWRTGEPVREHVVAGAISNFDLRADGAAVVGEFRTGIVALAPDAAQRKLSNRGTSPAFAGDAVVFVRRSGTIDDGYERLVVVGPGGRLRPFGVPSALIGPFVADERRVLRAAHGCVLTADLAAPAAAGAPSGSCPRSELQVRRARRAASGGPSLAVDVHVRVVDPAGRWTVERQSYAPQIEP